ncbi:MAG: hypothetical protein QXL89_04815 [Nitrososphaeria archaeon]
MGYRRRNMYYFTGIPGWIRFGYSPGWIGRSPTGLSPTAEWIISSGLMPQYRSYLAGRPTAGMQPPLSREEEVRMLEEQSKVIENQLNIIKERLERLKDTATGATQTVYYSPTQYGFIPLLSPEEELASLEDYKRRLEEEIKGVEARINELKKSSKEEK